ncbi:AraC family transcriptional regulator [Antrihabitans stalactiti]|uniref:Helix-turn-helix domain-containing protein n=1 Tax=Antrihabitans stalactiti TaxID=2584121 RepID=A0A848KQ05_9NOCA|nr:AraC family transcriptional regulator [Antrihabitans stalactiti]NMN98370.1 helix-turn-helix domain-containing protein [Antrihabitans stalactiti]
MPAMAAVRPEGVATTLTALYSVDQAVGRQQLLDEREELWEQAMRERLCPMEIRLSREDCGPGKVQSADLADLLLTDWDCPAMDGYLPRNANGELDRDVVVVMAGYGGEERQSFGGTDTLFGQGALLITSGEGVGRGSFSVRRSLRKRTLVLPGPALRAAGSGLKMPKSLALGPDRPLVNIFHTFLDQVWTGLPNMIAAEREATRTAVIALIAGIIRSEGVDVNDQSTLPALRAQLDKSIAERLRQGPIRLEDLAADHCVSTRTIYRAFALTGDTMKSVVRAQRLAAVRQDLLDTNLTIERIAHRWHYYDASHLGREFREVFGLSAGEYRQSYASGSGGSIRSTIDHCALGAS